MFFLAGCSAKNVEKEINGSDLISSLLENELKLKDPKNVVNESYKMGN